MIRKLYEGLVQTLLCLLAVSGIMAAFYVVWRLDHTLYCM